jgi:hypothetical protein
MGLYCARWMPGRLIALRFQAGATLDFDAAARRVLDCATCFLLVWGWHGLGWSQRNVLPTVRRCSDVTRPLSLTRNDPKMARSKLETRETESSARRSPDPHASQGIGRQDRDTTVVYPSAVSSYRETAHRRWIGRFRSVGPLSSVVEFTPP